VPITRSGARLAKLALASERCEARTGAVHSVLVEANAATAWLRLSTRVLGGSGPKILGPDQGVRRDATKRFALPNDPRSDAVSYLLTIRYPTPTRRSGTTKARDIGARVWGLCLSSRGFRGRAFGHRSWMLGRSGCAGGVPGHADDVGRLAWSVSGAITGRSRGFLRNAACGSACASRWSVAPARRGVHRAGERDRGAADGSMIRALGRSRGELRAGDDGPGAAVPALRQRLGGRRIRLRTDREATRGVPAGHRGEVTHLGAGVGAQGD
jgi:hypothetical protein